MNPESIINLQNQVNSLQAVVQDIEKAIKGIKIDVQSKLKSNVDIVPGIGTKFAYDKSGLIIHSEKLCASDIPELDVDNIKGLRKMLSDKISKSDIRSLTDVGIRDKQNYGEIVGTACKFNYDEHGNIVSVVDLTKDDLPKLDISDIDGLLEELELIKSNLNPEVSNSSIEHNKSVAGTYVKVNTDEHGHIISGSTTLTENDIPIEIINRINNIESLCSEFALRKVVNQLSTSITKKISANDPITSGTFTKVRVDVNGLILAGDKLTVKDIPLLPIDAIDKLDVELRSRAYKEDVIKLNETVNSILSNISKVSQVSKLLSELELKAPITDIHDISTRLDSLQKIVDQIVINIPIELINTEINTIKDSISTLEGRIITIENKLSLN